MYGRRRVAALLPSARRHSKNAPTNSVRIFDCTDASLNSLPHGTHTASRSRPVGISFRFSSSSNSSSRSSSPPVPPRTRPSRRPDRTVPSTRQVPQRLSVPSRSGSHRSMNTFNSDTGNRITSSEQLENPSQSSSSPLSRPVLPVISKSTGRNHRRAFLRSPIFQLIISPGNGSSTVGDTESSANHTEQEHVNLDDSVQILRTEESNTEHTLNRLRTTRSGRRTTRNNALTRRVSVNGSRSLSSLNNPCSVANISEHRRSQSVLSTEDVRAALAAARPPSSETDDECVICLCEKSNRSVVLPCMHTFCYDCIYRWLCINPSCPLCKRMAQRIIHSVLSDTEFTELLVSDLPANSGNRHSSTNRPLDTYDFTVTSGNTSTPTSHFDAYFIRFFDYIGNERRVTENQTSLYIPPRSYSPESMLPSSLSTVDSLNDQASNQYWWNTEYRSQAENCRYLLNVLVNNAVRPTESPLFDSLLLRQLVYVSSFDSLPVPQESGLVRNISPEFLRANETHQLRLAAFIRRELRVLAPWLAYGTDSNNTYERVGGNSAAVTAPLISGAPGLEAEPRELDEITELLVEHVCRVSITNDQAIVDLLSSQPAFHSSLVPTAYLYHFASELLQYAQFSGTLVEYDSSVCLFRRRVTLAELLGGSVRSRCRVSNRFPSDLRLAAYVASACWPRFRPGFSHPQQIFTRPLTFWLLRRLFVHSVSGARHPHPLPGTGENISNIPDQLLANGPPVLCHPDCLRLSSSVRVLLEALPPFRTLRNRNLSRNMTSSDFDSRCRNDGAMTNTELFPNRLLYQRILSELIDQARFTEALSEEYSQYNNRHRLIVSSLNSNPTVSDRQTSEVNISNEQSSTVYSSTRSDINRNISRSLQPAMNSHLSALRRLDGLILLFTARLPGMRVDPDDMISELLHMPLLSMTSTAAVIDLTNSRTTTSRPHRFYSDDTSGNRIDNGVINPSRFGEVDWDFSRREFTGILNSQSRVNIPSELENVEIPRNQPIEISSTIDAVDLTENSNASTGSALCVNVSPHYHSSGRNYHENTGYVVISSDSSDEDTVDRVERSSLVDRPSVLTSDESDESLDRITQASSLFHNCLVNTPFENHADLTHQNTSTSNTSSSSINNSSKNIQIDEMETTTAKLSLCPSVSIEGKSHTESILPSPSDHQEEPMEVDEAVEDNASANLTDVNRMKRRFTESFRYIYGLHSVSSLPANACKVIRKDICNLSSANESNHNKSERAELKASNLCFKPGRTCKRIGLSSPIHVETSDSDCEVVRESIRVDSDTSSSESSYSSTSSSFSSVSSSARPLDRSRRSPRRLKYLQKFRHKYKKHHRRYGGSRRHKHSCCCRCRVRRHKYHSSRDLVRKCHLLSTNDEEPVSLNRPSSPIVISDDDYDDANNENHVGDEPKYPQISSSPTQCTLVDSALESCAQTSGSLCQSLAPVILPKECLLTTHTLCSTTAAQSDENEASERDSLSNIQCSSHSSLLRNQVETKSDNDQNFLMHKPCTASEFYRFIAKCERKNDENLSPTSANKCFLSSHHNHLLNDSDLNELSNHNDCPDILDNENSKALNFVNCESIHYLDHGKNDQS